MHANIWTELYANEGEDAQPYQTNKLAFVFDGLGGAGGFIHSAYNKTSAYLGSRIFSNGIKKYFNKEHRLEKPFDEIDSGISTNEVLSKLGKEMAQFLSINGCIEMQNKGISFQEKPRGKSIKLLPTTIAGAIFREKEDSIEIISIWAGDSRVFLFTESGLKQISMDDEVIEKGESNRDYYEFIHLGDVRMSNQLSMSEKFYLNLRYISVKKPCLVICGTDGTFGYVNEPIDLERILMDNVIASDDIGNFVSTMERYYDKAHNDDCSLTINAFGFENEFEDVKEFMKKRYEIYKNQYLYLMDKSIEYNEYVSEKKNIIQKQIESDDETKSKIVSYIRTSFMDSVIENKESGINYNENEKIKELKLKIEKEENEYRKNIDNLVKEEKYLREKLEDTIREEWITIREYLLEQGIIVSNKGMDNLEKKYADTKKRYEENRKLADNSYLQYSNRMEKAYEDMCLIMKEMKQGIVDKEKLDVLMICTDDIKSNSRAYLREYKLNCNRLVKEEKEVNKLLKKLCEKETSKATNAIHKTVDLIMSSKVDSYFDESSHIFEIRDKLKLNELKKEESEIERVHNKVNVSKKYELFYENNEKNLYQWVMENYQDHILSILGIDMTKERKNTELKIKELEKKIHELEKYKNITYKSLWEEYQKGYEEFFELPIVKSTVVMPQEEYEKFLQSKQQKIMNNVNENNELMDEKDN